MEFLCRFVIFIHSVSLSNNYLSNQQSSFCIQGSTNSSSKGLHGGTVSTVKVTLDVTSELNGIVYTCQAMNEILQRSVHDAITLDVLCKIILECLIFSAAMIKCNKTANISSLNFLDKPVFENDPVEPFNGVEGQALLVALQAHGNPTNMTYVWKKDGKVLSQSSENHGRLLIDGPVLNISSLLKDDTGSYSCEAFNSEGTSSMDITISVNCECLFVNLFFTISIMCPVFNIVFFYKI